MERGRIDDSLLHPFVILIIGIIFVPFLVATSLRLGGNVLGFDMETAVADAAVTGIAVILQGITLTFLTVHHVIRAGGLGLTLRAIGIRVEGWRNEVRVGLLWGAVLLFVNVVTSNAAGFVFQRLMPEAEFQEQLNMETSALTEVLGFDAPLWVKLTLVVSAAVVAPVAEELFFRGYLHGVLRHRFGAAALFWSSMTFAFVHFYVINFIPIFLIGALLARLYERRGNIIAPIVAHATVNFVLLVVVWSGIAGGGGA